MQTHELSADGTYSKCGQFGAEDDFTMEDEQASCLSCRFFDKIQEAWEEYVTLPVIFGEDSLTIVQTEHDAFFAGAEMILKEVVPF